MASQIIPLKLCFTDIAGIRRTVRNIWNTNYRLKFTTPLTEKEFRADILSMLNEKAVNKFKCPLEELLHAIKNRLENDIYYDSIPPYDHIVFTDRMAIIVTVESGKPIVFVTNGHNKTILVDYM